MSGSGEKKDAAKGPANPEGAKKKKPVVQVQEQKKRTSEATGSVPGGVQRTEPLVEGIVKLNKCTNELVGIAVGQRKAIERRIGDVEKKADEAEKQTSTFSGELQVIKDGIDDTKEEIEKLDKKFKGEEDSRDAMRQEVTSAVQKNADTKGKVDGILATIGKLSPRVENLEKDLAELTQQFNEFKEESQEFVMKLAVRVGVVTQEQADELLKKDKEGDAE